jgi:Protein of unknown function (DUF2631).
VAGNQSPAPAAVQRSLQSEEPTHGAGAVAHATHAEVEHHEAGHDEPVVAPDQLKPPPFRRLTLFAALFTAAVLPLMAFVGNHEGNVEKIWLVGIAALIVIAIIADYFLRKAGLRN